MLGIVQSEADPASREIGAALRALTEWEVLTDASVPRSAGGGEYYRTDGAELRTFDRIHLELEHPERAFSERPSLVVFASRHAGETGPLLTGHFPGNFGPAAAGGEPGSLAPAAPEALAKLLEGLERHAPAGYDTGIECTHHGPTEIDVPALYAEVGSDEPAWRDGDAAAAVAAAILDLGELSPRPERRVVGFGGPHYAPRFERVIRESDWSVGHVCPDWALEALEEAPAVVGETFEKSGADLALLAERATSLRPTIEAAGHRVVSERWLREVGDRPLSLVESIEDALGPVGEAVRLGVPRDSAFEPIELPRGLLEAAEGVDREAVIETLERHTVAFETREAGTRAGDRALLPTDGDRRALVAALAGVLEETYETVRVTDGVVTATRRAFDPEAARERGVPEGPAFGTLAGGEPVTVDGEAITPEEVHVIEERQFTW